MAYRTGVALHHAVRDGTVACDGALRNAGPAMIAGGCVATGEAGMGLEAASAVIASAARRSVEGMNASTTTKTTSGMKAAAMETAAATMEATAPATVEATAPATVEATAPATVEATSPATVETTATATATVETAAAAPATARLGCVCVREPRHCAHQDRKRQNLSAPSSQHIFLHLD
jgi:hypothetical protein